MTEPLPIKNDAEWTEALAGRVVKTVEFGYTSMTVTFEDGTTLETCGYSAQSTDGFDADATLPDGRHLHYEEYGN